MRTMSSSSIFLHTLSVSVEGSSIPPRRNSIPSSVEVFVVYFYPGIKNPEIGFITLCLSILCSPSLTFCESLYIFIENLFQPKFVFRACNQEPKQLKDIFTRGWRHGSVVKSTSYSSRGLRFGSWHPHGCSQPLATLVPGDPKSCT